MSDRSNPEETREITLPASTVEKLEAFAKEIGIGINAVILQAVFGIKEESITDLEFMELDSGSDMGKTFIARSNSERELVRRLNAVKRSA
jgi:NRPS condensation-like uncharacterized protein